MTEERKKKDLVVHTKEVKACQNIVEASLEHVEAKNG